MDPGADGGTGSRAHREGGKGEGRGRRLVRVDDHEAAAQPVLAPVHGGAAQLLDAVLGHHDGEIPFVLHGVAGADLGRGSSDSAQTYSPSATPVIRTDSTRSLGSGSAARKSRTRWSADAVIASRAEAGSGTDLR